MSWTKERFDFGSGICFRLFEIEEKQKELHCHDCLEIDLVEEGDGNYIIGGRIYPVRTGDIFVINNSERHLAIHGEHGLKLSVLIFEADPIWKEKYGKDYSKYFGKTNGKYLDGCSENAADAKQAGKPVSAFLPAKMSRCHLVLFPEPPIKIRNRFKPRLHGNLCNRLFGSFQKIRRILDPGLLNISKHGLPGGIPETPAQIGAAHHCFLCQHLQRHGFGKMCINIA